MGDAMWILVLGLLIFFAVHSVRIVAGGFRDEQLAANPARWKALYSLASAVGLALIVWGWIVFRPDAPHVFDPPSWGRHAAMGLVFLAFVLLAAAYLPAGRIKVWLKHPMIVGVALWALGHLLVNGDLASIVLFGSFFAYAVVNRLTLTARGDPAPAVVAPASDLMAAAAGAVAFGVALWLHPVLFGVSPIA